MTPCKVWRNAAQKHNKVFVSVDTPDEFDPNKANDYATWWENADGNGDYFRSFAQEFIADSDIDESQVWLWDTPARRIHHL